MARAKRSQKVAVQQATKTAVASVTPGRVGEPVIGAFCPVCGHTIPAKRTIKQGHIPVDHVDYFESIDWDPNKSFGVSFVAKGRGSLRDWKYIDPDDAPELFQKLKARFIDAVQEWIQKGWLSPEEIGK